MVKNPPANAGEEGWISGSGRSPGGGNGNPHQYSCLGNPMDRGSWCCIQSVGSLRVRHHLVTGLAHTEATVKGETSHISLHLLSDKRQHTNISAGMIFFFLDDCMIDKAGISGFVLLSITDPVSSYQVEPSLLYIVFLMIDILTGMR